MAKYLFLAFGMSSSVATAFTMPSAPSQVNSTYDEIRTTDGATCRSANGGNVIFHGGISNATTSEHNDYGSNSNYNNDDEKGIYLGFAISYGGGKKIDCTRLANIEFEKAELELKKLRAEISALEELKKLHKLQAQGALPSLN